MNRAQWLVISLGLAACSRGAAKPSPANGSSNSQERSRCDPFEAATEPISLGTIIAAGRSRSGRLYVVEGEGRKPRVLVSRAGTLYRRRIEGWGLFDNDRLREYSVGSPGPSFHLQLEMNGDVPKAMGLADGTFTSPDQPTLELGAHGELLTLIAPAMVMNMPAQNLPAEVVVEYHARLADGRLLVVTRPRDDWSYRDFRLFFGPPLQVAERRVDDVRRLLDGGSTTIAFTVDGATAVASFPIIKFHAGPASVRLGAESLPLTRLPKEKPASAVFVCDDTLR